MALAYGGARVLLIDADMRRPGLHRPLRLTNERGLSQVLIGQARVRDVIQRTVDPNLLAITAGRTPPNPSELLASERMKTLLSNLSHGPFDWIVIDTPPVLAVTDAVDPRAARVRRDVRRRRRDDAPPPRRARARDASCRRTREFAAVVLNKVDFARNKYLLFALLRPPVQELLRRSRGLTGPRSRRRRDLLIAPRRHAVRVRRRIRLDGVRAGGGRRRPRRSLVRPAVAPPGNRWLDLPRSCVYVVVVAASLVPAAARPFGSRFPRRRASSI